MTQRTSGPAAARHELVHQAAVLRPVAAAPRSRTPNEDDPAGPGTRPAASAREDLAFVSSGNSGREQASRAAATAFRLVRGIRGQRGPRCDTAVPGLERHAARERLGVREPRLELDRRRRQHDPRRSGPTPEGRVRRPIRHLRSHDGGPAPSRGRNALISGHGPRPGADSAWKRPHRQVQADDGAESAMRRAMSSHGANPRSMRLSSVGEMPAALATVASDRPAACGPHAARRRDRRAGAGRGGRHGTRETPASAHPDRARSPADQLAALPPATIEP